ncbi:SDR family oxidoreductase [Polluticaenibacter yanchengensis]|uniref:SDR family oxidoreductase n=1 Tax=Polluticaenibacter yanchengensis TaxID=3014562 RepID=A0ABT4UMQ1_9BACT|nr:SDR family oxidoreductase [Chitinophagaceae bacterium LY-5]
MNNKFDLTDNVIFVTGAAGLIGSTISKYFLENKAKVIITDLNEPGLNAFYDNLDSSLKENCLSVVLDITNEQSCIDAVNASVDKFGRINTLINNAAIDAKFDKENNSKVNQSRFEFYPLDLLRKSVEVNLTGTIIITQVVCRQMLAQKSGNIINVASTYSIVSPNQNLYDYGNGVSQFKPIDYIASKSFIPNFTRYIATFYAQDGIRCNAIVPHGIENNHAEPFVKNFSKMSPLGRMCDREELTGPFGFLASEASSYMTGSTLMVDGGWTAW